MLLDDYLNYLYESKWKRLLAAGKLKADDLMKIKKASLPKSHRKWTAGVEKGTKEIARKKGIRVTTKLSPSEAKKAGVKPGSALQGPMQSSARIGIGKKPSIHIYKPIKKSEQTANAIIKRHEADEVAALKRLRKYKGKEKTMGPVRADASKYHSSPEVLRKERGLSRTATGLYRKKGGSNLMGIIHKDQYKTIPKGGRKGTRKLEKRKSKEFQKELEQDRKELKGNKKLFKNVLKDPTYGPRKERKRLAKHLTST